MATEANGVPSTLFVAWLATVVLHSSEGYVADCLP